MGRHRADRRDDRQWEAARLVGADNAEQPSAPPVTDQELTAPILDQEADTPRTAR